MYIVNIAVKWENGDLEGFGAAASTEAEAQRRAIAKAERKAAQYGTSFSVLTRNEYRALSVDEQDALQADWDMEML
jgi:hypothetical protein